MDKISTCLWQGRGVAGTGFDRRYQTSDCRTLVSVQISILKADYSTLIFAGGALLDVGVYVVSFASLFMKTALTGIASMAHLGETGVDEQSSMILGYDGEDGYSLYRNPD